MDNVLAILIVGVVAFALWLTMRIINRRERWAKRSAAALLVMVLVGYPLSVGPVCWIVGRNPNLVEGNLSFISEVPRAYWPIGWVADRVEFVKHAINRYAKMGMHPDSDIAFPTNYVRGGAFFIPY